MKSNSGHRARLRERFLKSGLDGFLDYEVLELLLTFGTPRKDCKQIAKNILTKHKTLDNVFNLNSDELEKINGVGSANSIGIKIYGEIKYLLSYQNLQTKKSLSSVDDIVEYLRSKIGNEKKEHFVILCLDSKSNLIYDEVSVGTLNASLVHPREVFSKAILHHANQIIIAHNHPSGDPTPSQSDLDTYNRLKEAGKVVGVNVHSCYIITTNNSSKVNL